MLLKIELRIVVEKLPGISATLLMSIIWRYCSLGIFQVLVAFLQVED
jgi:hypothetical protein